MRGIQALKTALGSKVGIHSMDLDSQFSLPRQEYGLTLFLGLLYHLKNPFYVLETLSRHTRFCLLSTRVAKFAPDKERLLEDLAVGYLVSPEEVNNDSTNYWIFSRKGLERLLGRTGWELCSYQSFGDLQTSDPSSQEGDERAFCLISSMRSIGRENALELISGWQPMEQAGWRWTNEQFSFKIRHPGWNKRVLYVRFILPESAFVGRDKI